MSIINNFSKNISDDILVVIMKFLFLLKMQFALHTKFEHFVLFY